MSSTFPPPKKGQGPVLSEELVEDMISLSFIVELVVLFSGFPRIAVFV